MVGDQKQLSSIVFSDKAKRAGYGQSLFGRLAITGQTSIMLDTQYRMDPLIRYVNSYLHFLVVGGYLS